MMKVIAADKTVRATDQKADLITVLLGVWMMVGLFLDGYAHTNIIEELESFITPWHAVFYSGFLATAGWITWTVYKGVRQGESLLAAIPAGYGLAVVGIGSFAVGGVGDAVWHTIWGIEAGIDALLSPTHLLLFVGIVLIISTPLRTAALRSSDGRLVGLDRANVTLSVTMTMAILAFFFEYIWAPGIRVWAEHHFNPATGEGEVYIALGIAAILISNLILLGPVAAVLARWYPPFGMVTVSWLTVNLLTAGAFDLHLGMAVTVGLAGGLIADGLAQGVGAGPDRRWASMVVLAAAPFVAWTVYFLIIKRSGLLNWPLEVIGGAVVFATLSGLGLGWLALPTSSNSKQAIPVPD